jgi:hypothetical protein
MGFSKSDKRAAETFGGIFTNAMTAMGEVIAKVRDIDMNGLESSDKKEVLLGEQRAQVEIMKDTNETAMGIFEKVLPLALQMGNEVAEQNRQRSKARMMEAEARLIEARARAAEVEVKRLNAQSERLKATRLRGWGGDVAPDEEELAEYYTSKKTVEC